MTERYDCGYLNDYGGGNVDWWWDYIRSEIERANDFHLERNEQLVSGSRENIDVVKLAKEMAFALYRQRGAHNEGDEKSRWFMDSPDNSCIGGPVSKQEFIAMASVVMECDNVFRDAIEKAAKLADDEATVILSNDLEYPADRVHDFLVVARRISRNIRGLVNQP